MRYAVRQLGKYGNSKINTHHTRPWVNRGWYLLLRLHGHVPAIHLPGDRNVFDLALYFPALAEAQSPDLG